MIIHDPRERRYERVPGTGGMRQVFFHLSGEARPTANPRYRTAPIREVLILDNKDEARLELQWRSGPVCICDIRFVWWYRLWLWGKELMYRMVPRRRNQVPAGDPCRYDPVRYNWDTGKTDKLCRCGKLPKDGESECPECLYLTQEIERDHE